MLFLGYLMCVTSSFAQLNENLNVLPEEVYIGYQPAYKFVEIVEYNVLSTRDNDAKISNDVQEITNMVQKANYCDKRYGFNYFESIEEELTIDRGFVEIRCVLLTEHGNLYDAIKDIFGKVLDRDVEVTISDESIGLHYFGDGVNVGGNNNAYTKKGTDQHVIFWKRDVPQLDAILNIRLKNKKEIVGGFTKNIVGSEFSQRKSNSFLSQGQPLLDFFQNDADIYRLRHIKYYGELIEEYYSKVGKYPFEGDEDVPIYSFVANDMQKKFTEKGAPYPHKRYEFKRFISTLEEGLGREIKEYYDPQLSPVNTPNFYIYKIYDNTYYFAVHISKHYGFATKIAEHYYKVEITNRPVEGQRAFGLYELISNKNYQEVINSKPVKQGFFEDRANQFLYHTKGK
ncbi:MAG: hypothetical protein KC733_12735 [Candidatus Omnitrophica bacterium]|nr:hypothetical protein [Candidatus Omnitrophota bacterium]